MARHVCVKTVLDILCKISDITLLVRLKKGSPYRPESLTPVSTSLLFLLYRLPDEVISTPTYEYSYKLPGIRQKTFSVALEGLLTARSFGGGFAIFT